MDVRRGVTLIELIVAIVIVGVLAALLIPAVQQSRESARRASCLANLAELAKACHGFESSANHLPGSYLSRGFSEKTPSEHRTVLSVWVNLLPFLDQESLAASIDHSETGYMGLATPPEGIVNSQHVRTHIPVVCCPSDRVPDGWCSYRVCRGSHFTGVQQETTCGALNGGMRKYPPRADGWIDGASQTVMFSERIVGDADNDVVSKSRDVGIHSQSRPDWLEYPVDSYLKDCQSQGGLAVPVQSHSGATWLLNGYLFTWYNHAAGPNWPQRDCGFSYSLDLTSTGARSQHAGGVNAVMADGSGRFMADSIDLRVWRALGTRAGGEVEQ